MLKPASANKLQFLKSSSLGKKSSLGSLKKVTNPSCQKEMSSVRYDNICWFTELLDAIEGSIHVKRKVVHEGSIVNYFPDLLAMLIVH
jgi:hypothetical protein